jgi:hypothetical protein
MQDNAGANQNNVRITTSSLHCAERDGQRHYGVSSRGFAYNPAPVDNQIARPDRDGQGDHDVVTEEPTLRVRWRERFSKRVIPIAFLLSVIGRRSTTPMAMTPATRC